MLQFAESAWISGAEEGSDLPGAFSHAENNGSEQGRKELRGVGIDGAPRLEELTIPQELFNRLGQQTASIQARFP